MAQGPSYGFDTLQIHAGSSPDPATGSRQTPIYQSTAFVFQDSDTQLGYSICKKLDISIRGLQIQQLLLCRTNCNIRGWCRCGLLFFRSRCANYGFVSINETRQKYNCVYASLWWNSNPIQQYDKTLWLERKICRF